MFFICWDLIKAITFLCDLRWLFDQLLSCFVLTDWRGEQQAEGTQKADASCCKKGEGRKISTREKEKAKPFRQAVPGEESVEMIRTVYFFFIYIKKYWTLLEDIVLVWWHMPINCLIITPANQANELRRIWLIITEQKRIKVMVAPYAWLVKASRWCSLILGLRISIVTSVIDWLSYHDRRQGDYDNWDREG